MDSMLLLLWRGRVLFRVLFLFGLIHVLIFLIDFLQFVALSVTHNIVKHNDFGFETHSLHFSLRLSADSLNDKDDTEENHRKEEENRKGGLWIVRGIIVFAPIGL